MSGKGDGRIRAAFLNLGTRMWGEYGTHPDTLDFDYPTWVRITERFRRAGGNMIVMDVGEGIVLPSCPELAVKGSWTPERLAKEQARLKSMGIELVPKLNFSTTHDAWLGEYTMMTSTPEYYRVCEAAVRDVIDIFGKPRFIHLGFDEERFTHHRRRRLARCRQGDLWWHDLDFLASVAFKAGARPWVWSDYIWHHEEEFLRRMNRDIVQSNWYYDASFDGADKTGAGRADGGETQDSLYDRVVRDFIKLDRAGFDQVPCGSIWEAYDNFAPLVRFCESRLFRERVLGFMMASWYMTRPDELWKHLFALDIMEETFASES